MEEKIKFFWGENYNIVDVWNGKNGFEREMFIICICILSFILKKNMLFFFFYNKFFFYENLWYDKLFIFYEGFKNYYIDRIFIVEKLFV